MRHGRSLALAIAVLAGFTVSIAGTEEQPPGLRLHRDLPRDPLIVLGLWLDDPSHDLDHVLLLGDPLGMGSLGSANAALETADSGRLSALRGEILSSLGSEIVLSIDIRSIDEATLAFRLSPARGISLLLSRVGVVASLRDAARLDAALRSLSSILGGEVVESEGGLVQLGIPFPPQPPPPPGTKPVASPPQIDVFYRIHQGRLALGFSREFVTESLAPRPDGQRLIDGDDWRKVFAELDPQPRDLVYINLPRLMQQIEASQLAQILFKSSPDVNAVAERFLTPESLKLGVGSTSVRVADGVRTRNFGPLWMSGAAMSTGALVALAAPQVVLAVDRGRARRTAIDVQAIARACDSFSNKARAYPGPTSGWVPVERIALQLEPVYISQLPRMDAWANPILYWSDGGSYRVISTGKDGRMDLDWSSVEDPAVPGGLEGDIVFGDGRQLAAPSDLALSPSK